MFRKILLPTDGSELSRRAVNSGVRFARDAGASVVALHVIPVPHEDQLEAWMHHDADYAERRQALFDKFADEQLAFAASSAAVEQVACTCMKVTANDVAKEIARTAEEAGCDLIYMASHGWKGGHAQAPGSETLKVLRYSKVPVLVHKPGPGRA